MTETNSTYGIRAGAFAQGLTVFDRDGHPHGLVKVQAYVRAKGEMKNKKLLTGEQNCNDFASALTGEHFLSLTPRLSAQSPKQAPRWDTSSYGQYALGRYFAEEISRVPLEKRTPMATMQQFWDTFPESPQGQNKLFNVIGHDYGQALNDPQANALALRLGINEAAAPRPGDAFVIHTLATQDMDRKVTDVRSGRSFEPKWPYHWAGVVAESGTDRVTLENYARHDPEGGPSTKEDPRWFFQMYGERQGQSFHEVNEATSGFANALTLAVQNPERGTPNIQNQPPQIQPPQIQAPRIQAPQIPVRQPSPSFWESFEGYATEFFKGWGTSSYDL